MQKTGIRWALALLGVLVWLICSGSATPSMAGDKRLVIGGKMFSEQYLLVEMAKLLLEKEGFSVTTRTGVGTVVARRSLESGQIDLYYEYTGTAYTVFFKQKDLMIMNDPAKVYKWVKQKDREKGLIWLDPVGFNNTYTLMMQKEQARELGVNSLRDLAALAVQKPHLVTIALDAEFWERPDGFKKLMRAYGFSLPAGNIKKMDPGLCYLALKNGQVLSAMGFATDGRVAAFGFVNLIDDKKFFPVYNPAPVVRAEVLTRYPRLRDILLPLSRKLDTTEMQKLNALVDVEHQSTERVARDWLTAKGLL